jgi:hypothetical protein
VVRQLRRQAPGRIRRGRRKKLVAAFRFDLEWKGHADWLAELRKEYPDEVPASKIPRRPDEAREELWHEFYWQAWNVLRFDRQYLDGGGELPITFIAYDAFARRYGIEGEAFDRFHIFMTAIDSEWLSYSVEKAKQRKEAES